MVDPHRERRRRFIPALAGNTFNSGGASNSNAVHPRAGGEHTSHAAPPAQLSGSSPRWRGTRDPVGGNLRGRRFIPALAGNTFVLYVFEGFHPVHPRAGGEHFDERLNAAASNGSSPRWRGTRPLPTPPADRARFIPALAGNTKWQCSPRWILPVHPRAGGEHTRGWSYMPWVIGSSPRWRGTRDHLYCQRNSTRFIPALAGNTRGPCAFWRCESVHPRAGGEHSCAQ